jgi:hypothetical protein
MSPEQCRGRDVDGRSDLYSLGIIMYEMFTGRPPFPPSSVPSLLHAHLATRPVRPSKLATVPPKLERIIMWCLAKKRDRRPRSAAQLRDALLPVLRELAEKNKRPRLVPDVASSVEARDRKPARSRKPQRLSWKFAAAMAALIVCVVLAVVVAEGGVDLGRFWSRTAPAYISKERAVLQGPGDGIRIRGKRTGFDVGETKRPDGVSGRRKSSTVVNRRSRRGAVGRLPK